MLCPQCLYEGNAVGGKCAYCGYEAVKASTSPLIAFADRSATPLPRSSSGMLPQFPTVYEPARGDVLCKGRYRLISQINLPETQKNQGTAWSGIDTKRSKQRVAIREICVPEEIARTTSVERAAYMAAQRLAELGNHPGFPSVIDFFRENNRYFLVQLYSEGESLASLLKRQGGALPEYLVAAYGYQVCEHLTLLANQHPPMVHGAINPETIIIGEDGQVASLIHLPAFRPDPLLPRKERGSTGYYAPEQIRGRTVPSSDLYSLAVTMHHAVTGYDPHTRLALFHPPIRRLNPAAAEKMGAILARQLSLSQAQRYQRPADMQRDLTTLIASYPDPIEEEPVVQEINLLSLNSAQLRERSRNALMLNMGVFAAVCVLLFIGILFAILRP